MANKTIKDYQDNTSIDGAADYFLGEQNSTGDYRRYTRNSIMGVTGNPADVSSTQTISNKTMDNSNTITVKDANFTLQDDGNTTRQAKFQLSGITAGQTRTYTLPDASSTLVDLSSSQTLINKTLTAPTISTPTFTTALAGVTLTSPTINTPTITGGTASGMTSVAATTGTFTNLTANSYNVLTEWQPLGYTPNTVTYNGQHSCSLVFNAVDLTTVLSPGKRLMTTRTVAAPTQCTSLNGTTQYYSKTTPNKMTYTDSFTFSAWVKPSSYALGTIIGRYSTTGSMLQMNTFGQLLIQAKDAGTADSCLTYQSLPLNKWTHVAMTMVISTNTVTAYFDGVAVPTLYTNGTTTQVTQAGNLEVGSNNGGTNPFPGKIAQAAIFSAVLSAATIQGMQSQTLSGSETSLVSAYSFNNSIIDLNTTTPNDLTANGSAVATNADSPFGTQGSGLISSTLDYGIVQSATFSTNTTTLVQFPEGCTIPTSGGISAVAYSGLKVPYGFPGQVNKWRITVPHKTTDSTTSNANYGSFMSGGWKMVVPVGSWKVGYSLPASYSSTTTQILFGFCPTDLTGISQVAGANVYNNILIRLVGNAGGNSSPSNNYIYDTFATTQTFIMYTFGASTSGSVDGNVAPNETYAENTLL